MCLWGCKRRERGKSSLRQWHRALLRVQVARARQVEFSDWHRMSPRVQAARTWQVEFCDWHRMSPRVQAARARHDELTGSYRVPLQVQAVKARQVKIANRLCVLNAVGAHEVNKFATYASKSKYNESVKIEFFQQRTRTHLCGSLQWECTSVQFADWRFCNILNKTLSARIHSICHLNTISWSTSRILRQSARIRLHRHMHVQKPITVTFANLGESYYQAMQWHLLHCLMIPHTPTASLCAVSHQSGWASDN